MSSELLLALVIGLCCGAVAGVGIALILDPYRPGKKRGKNKDDFKD